MLPLVAAVGIWTFNLALDVMSPAPSKLRVACDRVVERLLTTHDPVELERSRILVNTLDCSVSDRISKWPASRIGGL